MRANPQAVYINPPRAPALSVIWLHGLGADGHDFEPVVPMLDEVVRSQTRFVFPHAPIRAVTVNGGMAMRAWYDITDAQLDLRPDSEGIDDSVKTLGGYIETEIERGVAAHRIILAGFSQGGVIALRSGLLYPSRLGGIVALSTYVPMTNTLASQASACNRDIPIFMAHGEQDPLVTMRSASAGHDFLLSLAYQVEWKTYQMAHAVCPEEISDISAWLSARLA
jgi:phospholipase/carboxylesterase